MYWVPRPGLSTEGQRLFVKRKVAKTFFFEKKEAKTFFSKNGGEDFFSWKKEAEEFFPKPGLGNRQILTYPLKPGYT